jgi:hypothetical protein
MKTPRPSRAQDEGFALLTVLMFIGVMAVLTASMLKYSGSERRLNERNRLLLRARNMAENVALYASEQLTTKLYRLRSAAPMAFMTGSNAISLPPTNVLTTAYSTPADVEVRAGLTASTGLLYVDPSLAANANNPNAGLSVSTSTVPIIAKSTMRHPSLGTVTAYAEQDLQIAMIPLFQFAVFYNMDMEFGPGADMTISGPVHTNGNFIARIQTGMANTLRFTERATAAGGFYANTAYKGNTYMGDGSVDAGPGGTGPLNFQNPSGTITSIKSSGGTWRDHKYGTATASATTLNQFKTFATSTYSGNLRTSVHGVTALELPSIGGYKETDDPLTPEDDRKNGRQLIEPSDPNDSADLVQAKYARRSGLYIIVNPDDSTRTGRMPDGTDVSMRARSYRCFLNTVNTDGSHSISEVILPGQPSYGALNTINKFPNAYRLDTSVGHNQVLRIPLGDSGDTGYASPTIPTTFPTFSDSYFYDLRRGRGSNSYPFNRPSSNFVPRPIAKIDFDMTRFKMAVERTLLNATSSTVYYPSYPSSTTWSRSIFNSAGAVASHGLGVGSSYNYFSPSQITVESFDRQGNSAPGTYASRFVISESTDNGASWTVRYTSAADEISHVHTTSTGVTHVMVRQYLDGATPTATDDGSNDTTTRMVDQQIIPIATIDGSSTLSATLSSDYHIVAISSNGSIPSAHLAEAYTDMRVYVGGLDDTANWTFSVTGTTGGVVGSLGSGATANRYSLSSITSDNGTAIITATKGASTISKTFIVEKQSCKTIFNTPAQRTRWITANRGGEPFKIYFAPADPNDSRILTSPSDLEVRPSDLASTSTVSPWFDGVTVYVHSVDAEVKSSTAGVLDRVDSGVRLLNARGSVISLSSATYPGRTGFCFATNDAVYIVGHFNADGTINSSSTSTGIGGYSGRYAESSSEMLCAVMGDAITLLSQPLFTQSGSNYYQEDGWADSMSAHRRSSSGWSSSWQSSNPSASNSVDGIDTAVTPARMPNLTSRAGTNSGTGPNTFTTKLNPTTTELSTCLLTGIVRTTSLTRTPVADTSAQTSGGVHNFPRLQENWNGTGLYIRGSMVAMFESQVATEPWSIRSYSGAGRFWGLHQNLRAENGAHDLPLEPIVLNGQRIRYREVTPTEYTAQKTVIEALPH